MIKRLQVQFIAIFMVIMLVFAFSISVAIYTERKFDIEYQSMVWLLDILNFDNKEGSYDPLAGTAAPPCFVLEIDNRTDTSRVVYGSFFLRDRGVTTAALMQYMIGKMDETGVLPEYQMRYLNGVRQPGLHRIAFIDISTGTQMLESLRRNIILFDAASLLLMLVVAFFLSMWFVKPAKDGLRDQAQFISSITHEMKTPIAVISANMDLICSTADMENSDLSFACDNIRHECGQMNAMFDTMTKLSLAGKTGRGEWETVNLSRLFEQELLRFEVVAFEKGLGFSYDLAEKAELLCDETQLRTLLDIFVNNALKYCAPAGEIAVRLETHSDILRRRVRFSVRSSGEPIPKASLEKIFKPFYQVDSASRGAGLGLSIAKDIVDSMHGSIRVESAAGANTFIVEL